MANKKIYQFPIDTNLSGDNLFLMWADDITTVSSLSGVTNYIANNISFDDIYVTGGTCNGTDIILTRNDNNSISIPFTAETHTTGVRLVSNLLIFDTNQSINAYSVDLTPIKSISDFGFIIKQQTINQNITLPENSLIEYPSPLVMGSGYTLNVPGNTTLIIN